MGQAKRRSKHGGAVKYYAEYNLTYGPAGWKCPCCGGNREDKVLSRRKARRNRRLADKKVSTEE